MAPGLKGALGELYTIDEVAQRFRVSRRKLQAIIRDRPYYRVIGRRKLFTEADIQRLYESLPCPSNLSVDTAEKSSTSEAPSEAALWTKVRALLRER